MRRFKNIVLIEKGQTILIGFIFSLMLISFVSYNLYLGDGSYKKIRLQNIADAAVYSGAVAEAKVLNAISALNEGIVFINNLVTKIVLIWLLLRACAAFCFFGFGCQCIPPLNFFERYAKPLLNKLKDLAWAMANLQDSIINAGKYFVLFEIERIARQNDSSFALIYPFNPKGNPSSKSTLTFHLKRANEKSDFDQSKMTEEAVKLTSGDRDSLMSCYTKKWRSYEYNEAYSYYYRKNFTRNIDWIYKTEENRELIFDSPKGEKFHQGNKEVGDQTLTFSYAKTTECKKVSEILTMGYKLPSPIIMQNDFRERQKLIVLASFKPFKKSIFLTKNEHKSKNFYAVAQAKPFGSSVFDMDWNAKMEKASMVKELLESNKFLGDGFLKNNITCLADLIKH